MESLHTILEYAHSYIRWIITVLIIVSIVKAFLGMKNNSAFAKDRKIFSMTMASTHLQLVIGIVLFFIGQHGFNYFNVEGFMKDGGMRYWAVEHWFGMLVAIALITRGFISAKKMNDDAKKYRRVGVSYLIAFVIIIITIIHGVKSGLEPGFLS
tara:strand:- start:12 stop:473 length:462 start_codon:yes stop_codon:yes gene_type:complete